MSGIDSPYIKKPNRLSDVIAAIQAMSIYKYYKLDFSHWAERISGDANQAEYWQKVFEEHPEFFRLDSSRKKASLVWRRQYSKRYDVDNESIMSKEAYESLPPEKQLRVSRLPLTANDISALINIAVNIHARALEHKKESHWLIIALLSGLFSLLGALAGSGISN